MSDDLKTSRLGTPMQGECETSADACRSCV